MAMAQHGFGVLVGHHGCLRATLVGGAVALGAVVALVVVGSIPPLVAAASFAVISVGGAWLAVMAVRVATSMRNMPVPNRLLDSPATVVVDLTPAGRVLVQGENWAAVLDDPFRQQPIPAGQQVRVVAIENPRLIVTPSVEALLGQARAQSLAPPPPAPSPDAHAV
jgi:membrane protein implicated in regulation of membrane protease activity